MKAVLIIAFVLTSFVPPRADTKLDSTVYVCVSSGADVYHSTKNCAGIKNCTHEIRSVTREKAIKDYGRRACKRCY